MEKGKPLIQPGLFACHLSAEGRQAEHQGAYALLYRVLLNRYGISRPEIGRDERGKPYLPALPGVHFNLSHCAGLAVCGVGNAPLGVDGERIRPMRPNVMKRAFDPSEVQQVMASPRPDETFFRFWTLKESYVKAIGVGIGYPLQQVRFSLCPDGTIDTALPGYGFAQWIVEEQWTVACCMAAGEQMAKEVIWI